MRYYLYSIVAEQHYQSEWLFELISLGVVGQNGRRIYAENTLVSSKISKTITKQLRHNDLISPPHDRYTSGGYKYHPDHEGRVRDTVVLGRNSFIAEHLQAFFEQKPPTEFWAVSHLDWMVISSLLKKNVPPQFPEYCESLISLYPKTNELSKIKRIKFALDGALACKRFYENWEETR